MQVTNEIYNEIRLDVGKHGKTLQGLLDYVHFEAQKETLSSVLKRLEEPFTFVIVGEVKSGKSSFINALLAPGKEICRVAPSPMTDTIQQIVYGEKEHEEFISAFLKKIYQPIDILREIAIVDTPGTNTIIEHHQEITERFVPMSDLIIFVFEAKNPYRMSAWDFFDFIRDDWRKKVIFVLQQKDLMNEKDLEINLDGVRQNAIRKGIPEPEIFAVSALQEIEGKTEQSGYIPLRAYIQKNVTGGKAPFRKLIISVETLMNINEKLDKEMDVRRLQLDADKLFREDIQLTLDQQEKQTNEQVGLLIENVVSRFDRITSKYHEMLDDRLAFVNVFKKTIQSIFNKKDSLKFWLEQTMIGMESELRDGMSYKLSEGVKNISENIQFMVKTVDTKLQKNASILTSNQDIFRELADRRASIFEELQEAFADFLRKEENFYDKELVGTDRSFAPDFAAGSGIAAIGIILTALTQGAIFDITGGILTTLGFVFAGVSIGIKRKRIMQSFQQAISESRQKLQVHIDDKLHLYIAGVKARILRNFLEFDNYLLRETEDIRSIGERQKNIGDQFSRIHQKLSGLV